jgi:hypothetical protein
MLLCAAPQDGGRFVDSALGLQRAGQGVVALDERWVEGLGNVPLLSRVEQRGDTLELALYQRASVPTDGGPVVFAESLRSRVPGARSLEQVVPFTRGAEPALAVIGFGEEPDEQEVGIVVVAAGPKVLLRASGLRGPVPAGPKLDLGPQSEGFTIRDGGAELDAAFARKWIHVEGRDGGVEVSLGESHQRYLLAESTARQPPAHFQSFLVPIASTPAKGDRSAIEFAAPAPVRALEVASSSVDSIAFDAEPAMSFDLQLHPSDARVLGSAQVSERGKTARPRVLVFFDPPVVASRIRATAPGKALHLTAYRTAP